MVIPMLNVKSHDSHFDQNHRALTHSLKILILLCSLMG